MKKKEMMNNMQKKGEREREREFTHICFFLAAMFVPIHFCLLCNVSQVSLKNKLTVVVNPLHFLSFQLL